MSQAFQQAQAEAREAGIDPDGSFERTVHITHDELDELGYLTVDVWADEQKLTEIQSELHDTLENPERDGNDAIIAQNVPAMLRNGLIWECNAQPNRIGIDSPDDLREQLESGRVEMFGY